MSTLQPSLALTNHCQAEIWGDSTQVTYACNGLEEFEKSIHKELAEKRRDFGRWERINALDGRKEHREERKAKIEEIVAQHGKLESSAGHDFEVDCAHVRLQAVTANMNVVLATVAFARS